MNLVDELTQKQALKFQINDINKDFQETFYFIEETLLNNSEGIFDLDSTIVTHSAEALTNFLKRNNKDYNFELNCKVTNDNVTNYEIMFQKRWENN